MTDERDFNVPAISMRSGKGTHTKNPKQHREKFKKFIKNADLEEEDFDDWDD